MGFLKSLHLVEEVPLEDNNLADVYEGDNPGTYVDDETDLSTVQVDTLISDVYYQNGLDDLSKSIFKVEELINSLPKEMVTDVKVQSVKAILNSFGLTTSIVTEDGIKRVDILSSVMERLVKESDDEILSWSEQIEEHKRGIADLEAKIAKRSSETKQSSEMITAEKERIEGLIDFVGGE